MAAEDDFPETSYQYSTSNLCQPVPFALYGEAIKLVGDDDKVEDNFTLQGDAQPIISRKEVSLAATGMETPNENHIGHLTASPEPENAETALVIPLADPVNNHQALMAQARSFQVEYMRSGMIEDINSAIDYWSRAIEITSDGHIDKARSLNNLGCCYIARYERLGNISDLNDAIDCGALAAHLSPNSYEQKPAIISNLGSHYLCRYELLGHILDIERAIGHQARAVRLAPNSYAGKPGCLDQLGAAYNRRFERLGNLSDVTNAIKFQVQATELGNDFKDHPDRAAWFNNLGNSYLSRFGTLGEPTDINWAIESHSMAIELTLDGCPAKAKRLDNLGVSYNCRFLHSGELSDINSAIEFKLEAASLTPDGHPDKPARLSNLGNGYSSRFEIVGELSDLDLAIDCFDEAVRLTSDDHPDKPSWLAGLGTSYGLRFRRRREISDVEEGIRHLSRAYALLSNNDARKPQILMNMGNGYRYLFECRGGLSNIDKAIDCHREVVSLTPDTYAAKPGMLNNLGNCYRIRFAHTGDFSDSDKSIEFLSRAASLIPPGHMDTLSIFSSFGYAYLQRYSITLHIDDREAAIKYLRQAAMCSVGTPPDRFRASLQLARLLVSTKNPDGEAGYQEVIEQLPRLVWLGTTVEQRYDIIAKMGSFAPEAVAVAINHLGNYDRALEWLDTSRSIVWSQILQLRTSFDLLNAVDSSLAEKLSRTSRGLERAGARSSSAPPLANRLDLEKEARHHLDLAARWDRLVISAREIPGFENFMLPRSSSELKRVAKDGPVVVINVFSTACDALIIEPGKDGICHLSLSGFSQGTAMEFQSERGPLAGRLGAQSDARGFKRTQPRSSKSFAYMLATLWSGVVKPVLEFLRYMDKPTVGVLPHITWCTTGAISFLPIHAAGCYNAGSEISVSDFVVSSYTPTLSALLAHNSQNCSSQSSILAVGQETTDGFAPLPGTRLELTAIEKCAEKINYCKLEDERATVDSVLEAMDKHSWVHLACHATQDLDDPGKSAFHLHDGNLTLSEISKRAFKDKGLAFLSACQTATGSKLLPEEAVHLAAGMLMAGYPSVIASMWSIQDEDAPAIALDVYAGLLKDGKMDHTGAARALHKAVGRLRNEVGVASFERWAPFIHIGI